VSLRAHLFGSRPLRAQHLQHLIQRARNFADAHQRAVHRRKQRRIGRDRVREAFARQQRRVQLSDHGPQPPDIGVTGQEFQRVVEPRAGFQEQRQVPREGRDLGGARLSEQAETAGTGSRALVLDGFDRQQMQIFDAAGDLGQGRRGDRAVDDLAVLRQGPVAKIRHALTAGL